MNGLTVDGVVGGIDVEITAVVGPGLAAGADVDGLIVGAVGGIIDVDGMVTIALVIAGSEERNGDGRIAGPEDRRVGKAADEVGRIRPVGEVIGVAGLRGKHAEEDANIFGGSGVGCAVEADASDGEIVIGKASARGVSGIDGNGSD